MSPVKEALDKHYLPDDDNSSQDLDEETYEGKSEGKNLGQGHLQEA